MKRINKTKKGQMRQQRAYDEMERQFENFQTRHKPYEIKKRGENNDAGRSNQREDDI